MIIDGTTYPDGTDPSLIECLERARRAGTRVRVFHRDPATGEARVEYGGVGYVGRSLGPTRVPLLVHNSRSRGGNPISFPRIVRVETSKGARMLWEGNDHE